MSSEVCKNKEIRAIAAIQRAIEKYELDNFELKRVLSYFLQKSTGLDGFWIPYLKKDDENEMHEAGGGSEK